MKNAQVYGISLGLVSLGLVLVLYKLFVLDLSLFPEEETSVWTVQARLSFEGEAKPAKANLAIPEETAGFTLLGEDFISGNYGLAVSGSKDGKRKAEWAVRRAHGEQVLYYRGTFSRGNGDAGKYEKEVPQFPGRPKYDEPYDSAINAILDEVREESADIETYTRELLLQMNAAQATENVRLLRHISNSPEEWNQIVVDVLKGARIPARILQTLSLAEPSTEVPISYYLQVHNGNRWITFNPNSGEIGMPDSQLIWHVGTEPLYQLEGGRAARLQFSIAQSDRKIIDVLRMRAERIDAKLMSFTPYVLPVQTQNVYRILLTIPLGALLVVFMRTLVGIKTFGTFMPVLIALAFRETQLTTGIILFSMIVAVGLFIRFYLERLMLLLVPRLAAVLTVVTLLMLCLSLASNSLNFEKGLSVALFPLVIIAMTIERMSIVWEEYGDLEAIKQGAGSLFVAVLAYLLMSNQALSSLIFAFPELHFLTLAAALLMGRYTGYRLSELWRFRHIASRDIQP